MNSETQTPPRRGRPTLPDARRIVLPTRLNETEAKLIEKAAKKQKCDRTEWMRRTLVEAAQAA
jgi:uncharacterized protein (DUF1778 family)